MELQVQIAATFKNALAEALAPTAQQPAEDGVVSAREFGRLLGAYDPVIAEDLLAVIAEIQRLRETEPGLDRFLRQHGIVTRIREARP